MKVEIQYHCGHKGILDLFGEEIAVNARKQALEAKSCSECHRA